MRSCGSASIVKVGSIGSTVNRTCRYSECSNPVAAMSSMKATTERRTGVCWPASRRTWDNVWSMTSRRVVKLRPRTAPVLPLIATAPRFSAWNARIAVFSVSRSSCAAWPRRSVSCADRASAVTRACSVTASAIAVSRHRLRVWNSSTEMGALCSTASAVIVWQMSP